MTTASNLDKLSPAALLMAMEVISELLASSSPDAAGQALTEYLRELTGARTIMIMIHRENPLQHEILHICPTRRKNLFLPDELELFCPEHTPGDFPHHTIDLPADHPLHQPLLRAGINSIARYPLHVMGELIGQLLVFDIPELDRSTEIDKTISFLTPLISLALKNMLNLREISQQARELEQRVAERTSELQFTRFSIDRAADAIFWSKPDGRIIDVNQAACNSLGYNREELLQMNISDFDLNYKAEQFPEHFELIQQQKSLTFETNHRTKAGRTFPVEIATNYVRFNNQDYQCAFVRDITERKQNETKLQQACLAAEAANRAKSEFLANMSHEIRTPMNGVIGMTQLLRFTELTQDQKEYLDYIEQSGNNLMALLNDILDLSKIEAEKLDLEYADFSLRLALQELVANQTPLISQKNLALSISIPPEVPDLLSGDALRFKQILLNLLGNAVKFTEQGTISINGTVTSAQDDKVKIRIEVKDTGIGMSPAVLERIFVPFEQADNSSTRIYGGSGLGLAICRRLSELMGGRVWAESEKGKGSSFFVELPFTVHAAEDEQKNVDTNELFIHAAKKPLNLLIAEDNQLNAITLKAILTKLGHQAAVVENGQLVLKKWREQPWDCILMDVHMPILDGRLTTAAIRQQEHTLHGHIPIIAVTADAMLGDKDQLLAEGFDGYLSKPLDIQLLTEELARLTLNKHHQTT